MEYLTTSEIAAKWGISRRRVSVYCAEGRIEGAVQKGKMWLVPVDTKKPEDPRRIKQSQEDNNILDADFKLLSNKRRGGTG